AGGLRALRLLPPAAFARLPGPGAKPRGSLDDCFKQAGVPGRVTGLGSLFRLHAVDRELSDYRSTRATPAESERLVRLVRRLMEHGVLMSITGLGCLSTPMGDTELEGLVETFAAVLAMERKGGVAIASRSTSAAPSPTSSSSTPTDACTSRRCRPAWTTMLAPSSTGSARCSTRPGSAGATWWRCCTAPRSRPTRCSSSPAPGRGSSPP